MNRDRLGRKQTRNRGGAQAAEEAQRRQVCGPKDIWLRRFLPSVFIRVHPWFILLLAMCLPAGAAAKSRPVILTTDCGTEVDDQWAIAYLLTSPQLEVKGIVTTHAPNLKAPASETSAECAREIAHGYLKSRVPVFAGSPEPLPKPPRPLMNDGVRFILEMSRGYSRDNRLAVLAIGAATDVASALLADPTLSSRIELISMGFNDWPNDAKEWNVKNDVAAYQVIFDSSVPLTVGSTTVTKQHLRTDIASVREFAAGRGPLAGFLAGLFEKWVRANTDTAAREAGAKQWVLWDLVTVAHLLGLTKWKEVPRPILNPDISFSHPQTARTIRWITWIDGERVWADLRKQLK